MLSRTKLRSIAITILYQINIQKENNLSYDVDEIIKDNLKIDNQFVKELVHGVINHEQELIDLANKYLSNWKVNRINKVGAVILLSALYELKYMDTPSIVVINEAVNLAKEYSDEELAKMINAVLDRYIKE